MCLQRISTFTDREMCIQSCRSSNHIRTLIARINDGTVDSVDGNRSRCLQTGQEDITFRVQIDITTARIDGYPIRDADDRTVITNGGISKKCDIPRFRTQTCVIGQYDVIFRDDGDRTFNAFDFTIHTREIDSVAAGNPCPTCTVNRNFRSIGPGPCRGDNT